MYDFQTIKKAVEIWFSTDIDEDKWDYFKEILDKITVERNGKM